MKKRLLSLFLVLMLLLTVVPSVGALASGGTIYLEVGEECYEMLFEIPRDVAYYVSGLPGGMYIEEDPHVGQVGLILAGSTYTEGAYSVSVWADDGSSAERTIIVNDPQPVRQPPYITFQTRGIECEQGGWESIYVEVENPGGYDLYYSWYKDGAWYADGGSSITVDSSRVGTYYYVCEVGYYVNGVYNSITSSSIGVEIYNSTPVLNGIYMYSNPGKTVYNVGESLNTNGLGIVLCYSDGSEKVVWSGFKCNPTYMDKVGTRWIDVSYEGYYTGFNVSVKDEVSVTAIKVYQTPDKMNYNIGDKLDTAGLKLRVDYSDGGSSVISSGFRCTPDSFDKEGTQTVSVSYEGVVTSFNVSVQNPSKATGIAVASLPTKTEYNVGDKLDVSGMKIRISTAGGYNTVDALNNSKLSFEPEKLDKAGQQTIKVIYRDGEEEYTCEFTVHVSEAKAAQTPAADAAESQTATSSNTVLIVLLAAALAAIVALGTVVIVLAKKNKKADNK